MVSFKSFSSKHSENSNPDDNEFLDFSMTKVEEDAQKKGRASSPEFFDSIEVPK
jgi:hypothetical protein